MTTALRTLGVSDNETIPDSLRQGNHAAVR